MRSPWDLGTSDQRLASLRSLAQWRLRTDAERREVGDDQPLAVEDDALHLRVDEDVQPRVVERQPAHFIHGDLLGLVVERQARVHIVRPARPLVDERIKLGVRVVPVVVADARAKLLRDEVLRIGIVRAPDAVIHLQAGFRVGVRLVQAGAEGRQLQRLERDTDAQILLPEGLQHRCDALVIALDAVGQRDRADRLRCDACFVQRSSSPPPRQSSGPRWAARSRGCRAAECDRCATTVPCSTSLASVRFVDGERERAAHVHVIEGRDRVVEAHVAHREQRGGLEVGQVLHFGDVRRRNAVLLAADDVQLAGAVKLIGRLAVLNEGRA